MFITNFFFKPPHLLEELAKSFFLHIFCITTKNYKILVGGGNNAWLSNSPPTLNGVGHQ